MERSRSGPAAAVARPRLPGLLNVGTVTVVVVLVAAVALTARQTPPPTVAEFAPQAVEQIEESLPEQTDTSQEGPDGVAAAPTDVPSEPGAEDDGEPTPEPTASEPAIEEARVRRCVGDPPRQTEDPQSPPCVPYFEGDNGGETWQGVTKDEIRIAWPNLDFFGPEPADLMDALVQHFNTRYEFYGRKIVLQTYSAPAFATPDPTAMIADAVKVDEELQAFASLAYGARGGSEHHYYDELARRGVVSSSASTLALGTSERAARFAPFQWNYVPNMTDTLQLTGDFVCRTLAGKPPVGGTFAGTDPLDPTARPETRVFGVIVTRAQDGTVPPDAVLVDTMSACGATPVRVEDDVANPQGNNVMIQMSQAGVTSVICVCGDLASLRGTYMNAATQQGFFPEWIVPAWGNGTLDNSFNSCCAPQEQARNVLGIMGHDRLLPRQQMPWYWAVRESLPGRDVPGATYYTLMGRYWSLLQLASGIQLAGPELTPETFAQGLQRARFPNPGAGGPPQFQAPMSYASGFSARRDAAMFWYSTTDSGVIQPEQTGAICYVNEGRRYRVGEFPTEQQAWFESPCVR